MHRRHFLHAPLLLAATPIVAQASPKSPLPPLDEWHVFRGTKKFVYEMGATDPLCPKDEVWMKVASENPNATWAIYCDTSNLKSEVACRFDDIPSSLELIGPRERPPMSLREHPGALIADLLIPPRAYGNFRLVWTFPGEELPHASYPFRVSGS